MKWILNGGDGRWTSDEKSPCPKWEKDAGRATDGVMQGRWKTSLHSSSLTFMLSALYTLWVKCRRGPSVVGCHKPITWTSGAGAMNLFVGLQLVVFVWPTSIWPKGSVIGNESYWPQVNWRKEYHLEMMVIISTPFNCKPATWLTLLPSLLKNNETENLATAT